MITLAAHRIVAEGQAIEQSVRVVVMAGPSCQPGGRADETASEAVPRDRPALTDLPV